MGPMYVAYVTFASYTDCTFINLNIATLTDKWYGETPKLVAALFSLAAKVQPTIVFIDEIGMVNAEPRTDGRRRRRGGCIAGLRMLNDGERSGKADRLCFVMG